MSELDLLVLGSGIAGLTAAVRAADAGMRVGVITKGTIAQTATGWAQGGVAAVLGQIPADSIDQHLTDTLNAGAGLCDEDAVRVLVNDGPARVRELIALGAEFDRDPDGSLQLAREGGHSYACGPRRRRRDRRRDRTGARRIDRARRGGGARALFRCRSHHRARPLPWRVGARSGRRTARRPGHAHAAGHRRRGATVRDHDQSPRGDRRRHRDGPTRRRRGGRCRVRAVPSHGAGGRPHAEAVVERSTAGPRRAPARRGRRAVRRRAPAPRHRGARSCNRPSSTVATSSGSTRDRSRTSAGATRR